jgi:hypothetical protein
VVIAARSGEPGESLAHHALRNPPPFKSPDRRVIAECFLGGRIYDVQDEAWRYCNRRGTDPATRNHRLELVQDADVRAGVRQALQGFPEVPCNFPHAQIAVGGRPPP